MDSKATSADRSDSAPEPEAPPAIAREFVSTAEVRDAGLSLCQTLRPLANPEQLDLIARIEGHLSQEVAASDVPRLVESLARLARLVTQHAALRDTTRAAEALTKLLRRDLWRSALLQLLDGTTPFLSAFGRETAARARVRVADAESLGVEEACGEVLADLESRNAPMALRSALGRALFEYLLVSPDLPGRRQRFLT